MKRKKLMNFWSFGILFQLGRKIREKLISEAFFKSVCIREGGDDLMPSC
jgi:hypothetical protein